MPFIAGQSGNPYGRPRSGETWAALFERQLRKKVEVDGKKITYKELLVRRTLKEALSGDLKAIAHVFDRTEGKPFQQVDHTTKGEAILPAPIIMDFDPETLGRE